MKARPFVVLFTFAALIAAFWMAPGTAPVYAQQKGAPAQGAPGPGAGFGRAGTPTFPGPPAGMQALPGDPDLRIASKPVNADELLGLAQVLTTH